MPDLQKLLPKEAEFEVIFNGQKKPTKLVLRPYTLRDEAYLREAFDLEELQKGLESLDPTILAKLLWRQLDAKSKKIFKDVKAIDDDGNEIELHSHEKLMESFGGIQQVVLAFNALMKSRGLNSILEDLTDDGSKKKTKA